VGPPWRLGVTSELAPTRSHWQHVPGFEFGRYAAELHHECDVTCKLVVPPLPRTSLLYTCADREAKRVDGVEGPLVRTTQL
jgi:hypothetical protein